MWESADLLLQASLTSLLHNSVSKVVLSGWDGLWKQKVLLPLGLNFIWSREWKLMPAAIVGKIGNLLENWKHSSVSLRLCTFLGSWTNHENNRDPEAERAIGVLSVEKCWWKSGTSMGPRKKHSKDPCKGDCDVANDLFGWKEKLPSGFPLSHLPPSHHNKSPNLFSARPEQTPVSRASAS